MAVALAPFGSGVVAAQDAWATVRRHGDPLLVGGPGEDRHATPAVMAFVDRLPAQPLRRVAAAAFDTRLAWPRALSGSSARQIGRRLRSAGAHLVEQPDSCLVDLAPALRPGQLERAAARAREVARTYPANPALLTLHEAPVA